MTQLHVHKSLQINDIGKFKSKTWVKKKNRMAVLISDKIDFKVEKNYQGLRETFHNHKRVHSPIRHHNPKWTCT